MQHPGSILAGIDGGGTRTRLALARSNGCVFAFAESGCCSFVELGRQRARDVLEQLWHDAWRAAGSEPRPVDAVFIGTGSILSDADGKINCDLARSLRFAPAKNIAAENDASNALAGALAGRPGLLLISGTGSVCFGRNAKGTTWRCGGWGHLLDDRGSAYALVRAAIVAVTRAADGRGRTTALTGIVREKLGLQDLKDIYRKVHCEGVDRAAIAALAPCVVAAAADGDPVADGILEEAAIGLAEMVMVTAHQLQLQQPELALTGGLITNATAFRHRFIARAKTQLPGLTICEDGFAPVLGALMLASRRITGALPDASFLENLRQSTTNLQLKL